MRPRFKILQGQSQYGIFDSWQNALHRAMTRLGIPCELTPLSESYSTPYCEDEISLGFNLTRTWSREQAHRRHLAWVVDHPCFQATFFMAEATGFPVNYDACCMGSVDMHWAETARSIYGFPSIYFLPHATCLEAPVPPAGADRPLEVVFFGSLEDPEQCLAKLRGFVAAQMPDCTPLADALARDFQYGPAGELDSAVLAVLRAYRFPEKALRIFMSSIFPQLDLYHRYRSRLKVLKSLKTSRVDVYGSGPWSGAGLSENVAVHAPVSHAQALEIMRQARVVLHHAPTLAAGGHERVFDALASGCRVVSTASAFLQREFDGNGSVLFYAPEEGADSVLAEALASERAPETMEDAQARVFQRHDMAARARRLCELVSLRWPEVFGPERGGDA